MRRAPAFIQLLALLLAPAPLQAAALLEEAVQDSARASSFLNVLRLTVGIAPDRLLVVAVSIADPQVEVGGISWQGAALTQLAARSVQTSGAGCRVELWTLVDPAPGNNLLRVTLSGSTGFGLGAVVYSGVSARSPTSAVAWDQGTRTDLEAVVPSPDGRPVLGAACIGGGWITGPGPGAPMAMASPGGRTLWDFTEPGVVGVGSHRISSGGRATLRWDVNASSTFTWLSAALSITPLIDAPPPDAGAEDDAGEPTDALGPEAGVPDAADDAALDAGDDGPPPLADAMAEEDAPLARRDIALDVGCACRTGGPRGGLTPMVLLLLAVLARRRRR